MIRSFMVLVGLALLGACRGADLPNREHPPPGERTGSPYSTGSDSGAAHQPIEGANTGIEFEAPRRIPGVLAALANAIRQPDQRNLTALRGDLGTLEDGMRNDLSRVGLADTGAFHALTDSLALQLGGGAGGLARQVPSQELPVLESRVRRLIEIYERMMSSVRK